VSKYGSEEGSKLNEQIAQIVSTFIDGTDSRVSNMQLITLEKQIRKFAQGGKIDNSIARMASTARSDITRSSKSSRPTTGLSVSSYGSLLEGVKNNKPCAGLAPALRNEWLIMDTYNQLKEEDAQQEERRMAIDKVRRMKAHLDEQMVAQEQQRRLDAIEKEAYIESQRQMFEKFLLEQKEEKKVAHEKLLEEKRNREEQIKLQKQQRDREVRAKVREDARVLQEAKRFLEMEREIAKRKMDRRHKELRDMLHENVKQKAQRDLEAELDTQRQLKMMEEYKARVEAEEQKRKKDYEKRAQRYADIGQKWESSGAGKLQREADLALERKILREEQQKLEADQRREEGDRRALVENRIKCQKDNLKLIQEQQERKEAARKSDRDFARGLALDAEQWKIGEIQRVKARQQRMEVYGKMLTEQLEEVRARERNVLMSDAERSVNSSTLRRLQQDAGIMARVAKRVVDGEPLRKIKDDLAMPPLSC
jgi:hypothetical protein